MRVVRSKRSNTSLQNNLRFYGYSLFLPSNIGDTYWCLGSLEVGSDGLSQLVCKWKGNRDSFKVSVNLSGNASCVSSVCPAISRTRVGTNNFGNLGAVFDELEGGDTANGLSLRESLSKACHKAC